MTTQYYAVIVNTPTDEDGLFRQYVKIIELYGHHGVHNGIVLWDERSMGEVRAWDAINEVFYTIPWYDLANEGTYLKAHGGVNNGIPYIDDFTQNGYVDDWLNGHKLWMLEYHRQSIPVWAVKGYLYQIPDGGSNKLATMNTIIEATYATEPLNKVRWEEREFMHWGDPIYLLIQDELGVTHFSLKNDFDWMIPENYNEYNEETI